jgi:hypothetical protein
MNKLLLSSLAAAALTSVFYVVSRALVLDQGGAAVLAAFAAFACVPPFAAVTVCAGFAASFACLAGFAAFAAFVPVVPVGFIVAACVACLFVSLSIGFVPLADELCLKWQWALAVVFLEAVAIFTGMHWAAPWLALVALAAAYAGLWLANRSNPARFAKAA